jgi:integrase
VARGKKLKARRGRGEGSIEELPSGKWRVIVSGGKDPATGKRLKKTATFESKVQALAWKNEQIQAAGEKTEARTVLEEWTRRWLAEVQRTREANTYTYYERRLRRYVLPRLGQEPLASLSRDRVQDFVESLVRDEVTPGEQVCTLKTLRACLRAAVKMGWMREDPTAGIHRSKPKRVKELPVWTRVQVQSFLQAVQGDRYEALYVLALDSGMRPGELLALHWPDVDLLQGTVFVRQSLEDIAGRIRLKPTKTKKGRRVIPLAESTVALLRRHREQMTGQKRDVEKGPVFTSPHGHWLRMTTLRRNSFHAMLKRAGLSQVRPYVWRHTCATLLLQNGVNVKVVSERLGHESIEITLEHYAHCLPTMQSLAAKTMQELLACPTVVPQSDRECLQSFGVSDWLIWA